MRPLNHQTGHQRAPRYLSQQPQNDQAYSALPTGIDDHVTFPTSFNANAMHQRLSYDFNNAASLDPHLFTFEELLHFRTPSFQRRHTDPMASSYSFASSISQPHPTSHYNSSMLPQNYIPAPAVSQPNEAMSGPTTSPARPSRSISNAAQVSSAPADPSTATARRQGSGASASDSAKSRGLQFASWNDASKAYTARFRQKLNISDDDVDEVELNPHTHVKSLVEALKSEGFKHPPIERKQIGDGRLAMRPVDEQVRQQYIEAYQRAEVGCNKILAEADSDLEVEYHAWNIFKECINVHRIGRCNSTIRDLFVKCSERIQKAIQTIKDHSNVRRKMLEADDVPGFCANPDGYAYQVTRNLDNNIKRKLKGNTTNGTTANQKPADQDTANEEQVEEEQAVSEQAAKKPAPKRNFKQNTAGRGAAAEGGAAIRRRRPVTETAKEPRGAKKQKQSAGQVVTMGRQQDSTASDAAASSIEQSSFAPPNSNGQQNVVISRGDTDESGQVSYTPSSSDYPTAGVASTPASTQYYQAEVFNSDHTGSTDNFTSAATNTDTASDNATFDNRDMFLRMMDGIDDSGRPKPGAHHGWPAQTPDHSAPLNTPVDFNNITPTNAVAAEFNFCHNTAQAPMGVRPILHTREPTYLAAQPPGSQYHAINSQSSLRPAYPGQGYSLVNGMIYSDASHGSLETSLLVNGTYQPAPSHTKRKRSDDKFM